MEHVTVQCEENKIVIEGEIDPTIETTNMCIGSHMQEEEIFKCAAIEIKCDGNVLVEDLPKMYKWINENSRVDDTVKDCSKWRITLERIT